MRNNKLKYFRLIDKFIGDVCCSLLAINKFIFKKKKKGLESNKIRNILLIKLWGFGSILLMTPTIRALKKKYSNAKITILTNEQNKDLCKRLELIDRIITISTKGIAKALKDIIKTILIIRKRKFDVVIDYEFFVGASAIITYLSKAHFKIGFKSKRIHSRNKLYDKAIPFKRENHITKNFANLIKPLGINKVDYKPEKLKLTQEDRKYASLLLRRSGVKNKDKIICININAGELAFERKWPKENFVELTKRIIRKYPNTKIMFIGSKKDKDYVDSTLESLKHKSVINLAGKLNISQLQVLFEKSTLLITNDSGPMHLAAVTGIKTICLFGPESPLLYAPLNKNSIIIYKNLKCSPCMDIYNRKRIKCHNNAECMKNISVNEVFRKIKHPDKYTKKRIERILLVSPHYTILKGHYKTLAPPLGLAYIGAVLEREEYIVRILDVAAEGFKHEIPINKNMIRYGLNYRKIEERIKDFNPDVVGVSCILSNQFNSVKDICKMVKTIDKDIITIVGGEHPSALPEESLKNEFIDFVILGEGEHSIVQLMKCINQGGDISTIDGVAFRKKGKIIVNPKRKFIENLDELPFPARHLLPMEKYFKISLPQGLTYTRTPNTSMMTSRGCSANCVFCATTRFWGNKYRTRSAKNVLSEIEHLVNTYGIKEIQFIDDNLTLNKERAMNIFRGMKKRFNVSWSTPQGIAPWTLDKELLRTMKESGCYEITLAIESGDQNVLNKIIGKPGNLEKVKSLMKEIKKLKIMTKGFFVVGLPGETKEQILKTFKFASKLNLDSASFFLATPLPGTRLYNVCVEKGYLRKGFNLTALNYDTANIETPEFSAKELESLVSRNMLIFNLKLLVKNPIKFIKKYSLLLFNNPKIMIRYGLSLMRKAR